MPAGERMMDKIDSEIDIGALFGRLDDPNQGTWSPISALQRKPTGARHMRSKNDLRTRRGSLGAKKDLVIAHGHSVTIAQMEERRIEVHLLDEMAFAQDSLAHAPEIDPADAARRRSRS